VSHVMRSINVRYLLTYLLYTVKNREPIRVERSHSDDEGGDSG